jgi:hypothetical protein
MFAIALRCKMEIARGCCCRDASILPLAKIGVMFSPGILDDLDHRARCRRSDFMDDALSGLFNKFDRGTISRLSVR